MKNLIPARFYSYDSTRLFVSVAFTLAIDAVRRHRLSMRASALRSWKASWTDVRGAR